MSLSGAAMLFLAVIIVVNWFGERVRVRPAYIVSGFVVFLLLAFFAPTFYVALPWR